MAPLSTFMIKVTKNNQIMIIIIIEKSIFVKSAHNFKPLE